jgi:hypothetical protein
VQRVSEKLYFHTPLTIKYKYLMNILYSEFRIRLIVENTHRTSLIGSDLERGPPIDSRLELQVMRYNSVGDIGDWNLLRRLMKVFAPNSDESPDQRHQGLFEKKAKCC